MNKSTPPSPKTDAYAKRFNQVFDYIDKHLDEPLGLEELSHVANFSRFHFQRQFSEYCGMTPGCYIQLMRLKRAAYRLVFNPLLRVVDIALDAGYANAESFSRSFKITFDQTPTGFRRNPDWAHWSAQCQLPARERMEKMEVSIVDTVTTLVAALEHVVAQRWSMPASAASSHGAKAVASRRCEPARHSASPMTIRKRRRRTNIVSTFAAASGSRLRKIHTA